LKVGIVVFPGTNCERDVAHALGLFGADTELVWHRETDLDGFDRIVLPGGFAHGDYLRAGAIARFSPVMGPVADAAAAGVPVLGICNGFQILCEAGLLPGALIANRDLRFICRPVHVRVESTASILTRAAKPGQVLRIPLNSYEGNYVPGDAVPEPVLRYCEPDGAGSDAANPNGSIDAIAGVEDFMVSTDGRVLLESFLAS
jgi:phosphoribosylformylglycinamidine synthase I